MTQSWVTASLVSLRVHVQRFWRRENAPPDWRCIQNEDGVENTVGLKIIYFLCFVWRILLFERHRRRGLPSSRFAVVILKRLETLLKTDIVIGTDTTIVIAGSTGGFLTLEGCKTSVYSIKYGSSLTVAAFKMLKFNLLIFLNLFAFYLPSPS